MLPLLTIALVLLQSTSAATPPRVLPSDYWLSKRASMVEAVWGWGRSLPTKSTPDGVAPTNVTGVTEIRWDLGSPGNATHHGPALTSRVYQVLRSGDSGASGSGAKRVKRAKRAFLLHHGHSDAPEENGTWYDHYNMSAFLMDMADADVFIISMPLMGCNHVPNVSSLNDPHKWFEQWETVGNSPQVPSAATMRFFMEPVVLTTNFALRLGYDEVSMTGKSGGGWTTTLSAAMDPRLLLTIPDAGSMPFEFNHTSWDYEQRPERGPGAVYAECDFKCQYVLAGLDPGRVSIQLLHENDPCCFRGHGRHPRILAYNDAVQSVLLSRGDGGWFSTAVVDWPLHEYSLRDRAVMTQTWAAYRRHADVKAYSKIPCDILRAKDIWCGV